ncbi:MAG: hypothetical protein K1X92_11195 [Bacteroidia bacterium]|nr:hypothetical protein [Bacteroidia bacterium]
MKTNTPNYYNLPKGSSTKDLVNILLSFLEEKLPEFVIWFKTQNPTKKPNEDMITQKLLRFFRKIELDTGRNFCFGYERESISEESPKGAVDVGFFRFVNSIDELFFTMEAKVLPTPNKDKSRSDSEYVYTEVGKKGKGGIERFKLNLHGVNLPQNAMIAYIEKEDFTFWHKKINTWIEEIGWENEFLSQPTINKIAILNSKHKRQKGEVALTHFWLNL